MLKKNLILAIFGATALFVSCKKTTDENKTTADGKQYPQKVQKVVD